MIVSFKHKGLKLFYEKGDASKLQPQHLSKIRLILTRLDATKAVEELNVPGYGLHELKGELLYGLSLIKRTMAMFNPAHPGELIRETIDGIIEETGKKLTVEEVAIGLGTTRKTLSAIINGKQSVTPEMAIKLSTGFSNTTAEFWLQIQDNYDLFQARKKVDTKNIRVFWKAAVL